MQIGLIIVTIIGYQFILTSAKVLSRCEIAKELKNNDFSNSYLSHWVCLVENESKGNTSKVAQYPLFHKYGIFQISSGEWCGRGYVGGTCNIKCNDLLTDKVDADIKCAKLIYERHGFKWWKGWQSKCKQKPLPNISSCFYKN